MNSEKISPYRHVPNTITCLNLFCGCLSIVATFSGMSAIAAYLILAAAVFDFLDGFAARWLNVYSDLGKQLDSLADLVSFGVAPASIMYILLFDALPFDINIDAHTFGAAAAYVIAVFSALRLAKFNIDKRQSDAFIGLPTPANAIFICSLVFIAASDSQWSLLTANLFFLLTVTALSSFLLVAEIPLFSLKFKSFVWKNNKIRYIFVFISVMVLIMLQWVGLAVVILIYIVLSFCSNLLCNREISHE